MSRTPLLLRTVVVVVAVIAVLAPAGVAAAAAPADKPAVLSNWTQTSAASSATWNTAQTHRGDWTAYGFDWSTDYCSSSPENPLGFNFKLSCQRHDFGYRNYKAAGAFPANKDRLDSMFYADLKRKCAGYVVIVRPACLSLAWTYYQAVHIFGSFAAVSAVDVAAAASLAPAAELAKLNR
jgi:hypothetical protein